MAESGCTDWIQCRVPFARQACRGGEAAAVSPCICFIFTDYARGSHTGFPESTRFRAAAWARLLKGYRLFSITKKSTKTSRHWKCVFFLLWCAKAWPSWELKKIQCKQNSIPPLSTLKQPILIQLASAWRCRLRCGRRILSHKYWCYSLKVGKLFCK